MDILVSSNLERLLFDIYDESAPSIKQLMKQLNNDGKYSIDDGARAKLHEHFNAGFATQQEVLQEIKRIYQQDGYVIDPHTAVASFVANQYYAANNDPTLNVIISTASPYKFPETVYQAITDKQSSVTGLDAITELHKLLLQPLSPNVQQLFDQKQQSDRVIQPAQMKPTIRQILQLQ